MEGFQSVGLMSQKMKEFEVYDGNNVFSRNFQGIWFRVGRVFEQI